MFAPTFAGSIIYQVMRFFKYLIYRCCKSCCLTTNNWELNARNRGGATTSVPDVLHDPELERLDKAIHLNEMQLKALAMTEDVDGYFSNGDEFGSDRFGSGQLPNDQDLNDALMALKLGIAEGHDDASPASSRGRRGGRNSGRDSSDTSPRPHGKRGSKSGRRHGGGSSSGGSRTSRSGSGRSRHHGSGKRRESGDSYGADGGNTSSNAGAGGASGGSGNEDSGRGGETTFIIRAGAVTAQTTTRGHEAPANQRFTTADSMASEVVDLEQELAKGDRVHALLSDRYKQQRRAVVCVVVKGGRANTLLSAIQAAISRSRH